MLRGKGREGIGGRGGDGGEEWGDSGLKLCHNEGVPRTRRSWLGCWVINDGLKTVGEAAAEDESEGDNPYNPSS